jgi:DNA-binding LytR/AlgR family response regulator
MKKRVGAKRNETRTDAELLKLVLERLQYLDPPIKKFPVQPPDPAMAVYFVDLKDVCYITTKSDHGREETMLMMTSGKGYYSNLRLSEIEEKLKEHPHFLRTSKYYLINLTNIRGLKVSSARDLWFDGLHEPVVNAVTSTYLADFEKRLK